jgi:hypothetical protein
MKTVMQTPMTTITARIGTALRKRLDASMTDEPSGEMSRLLLQLENTVADEDFPHDPCNARRPRPS